MHRRSASRSIRTSGGWTIGAIFVLIGVFMLARNMNLVGVQNWWAFFILIPALTGFGTFVNDLRSTGSITARGRNGLISGVVLTSIAVIFILNQNWRVFGPGILIMGGLAMLLNNMLKSND
jgi:hypothetical protein